jgi:uncharacterized protein (DUF1810 family)
MEDPYRLERFVDAQDRTGADSYKAAVSELRTGRKVGHWMWYVFPQVAGLGRSWMSREFAISSLAEAQAYLQHPVLGPRLIECTRILLTINGKSASDILGAIDAMKLRSSITLFMSAAPDEAVFREVLEEYFQGSPDQETVARLVVT